MPPGIADCCCDCNFEADAFGRAPTSGTSPGRLGLDWNVISGDWQIVGPTITMPSGTVYTATTDSNFLTISGPGQLACLRNADLPANYWVNIGMLDTNIAADTQMPTGAVMRMYVLCNGTPGANYVEWKGGEAGDSSNYVKLVGDTTVNFPGASMILPVGTPLSGAGGAGASVGVEKNSDGTYTLFANRSGSLTEYVQVSSASGNSFVLEVVSTPSIIVIGTPAYTGPKIVGTNLNTTACPTYFGCGPVLPAGKSPPIAQLSAVVSGDGSNDGTYVLSCQGGCTWSQTSGSYTVSVVLSYNALTNVTTILVTAGGHSYSTTQSGVPNLESSSWGTVRGSSGGVTITVTSLYS